MFSIEVGIWRTCLLEQIYASMALGQHRLAVTEVESPRRTGLHARRDQAIGQAVLAEVALEGLALAGKHVGVQAGYAKGTELSTVAAAVAEVLLHGHNTQLRILLQCD